MSSMLNDILHGLEILENSEEVPKYVLDPAKFPKSSVDQIVSELPGHPWFTEPYLYFMNNPNTPTPPSAGLQDVLNNLSDNIRQCLNVSKRQPFLKAMAEHGHPIRFINLPLSNVVYLGSVRTKHGLFAF